jgi:hypothetical protein
MAIFIRPHLVDIIRDHGYGIRYPPYEYGHALRLVAKDVLRNPDREIVLVIAEDNLYPTCQYLRENRMGNETMKRT